MIEMLRKTSFSINTMKRLFFVTFLVLVFPFLQGCRAKLYPVEGTVTLDDKPIQSGYIMFYGDSGNGIEGSARIADGKFTGKAVRGNNLVKIRGYAKADQATPDPNLDGATVSKVQITKDELHWDNPEAVVDLSSGKADFSLKSGK